MKGDESMASGEGASRADQTIAKKRRLLEVARREFVSRGYRGVTMDAIAQAAQVSKRSLYLWHEDKAALFRACVIQGAERFPTPSFNPTIRPDESLSIFATSLLEEFAQPSTLGMGRLVIRESHDFPELPAITVRSHDEYLVQPLADQLAAIGLEGGNARASAELFIAMILAPVHNHLLMGTPLPDDPAIKRHVAHATRTFLHGQGS